MTEHPLHRSWDLFYDGGGKDAAQNKRQHAWKAYSKVCGFSTVEDFWRIFNNLADVGLLDGKRDFFLFEHGIEPDWDDAGNVRGGLWLVHCNECLKADVNDGVPDTNFSLDTLWRETVYHAVGENFPHSTEVVGIALNLRKTGARLAVWIRGTLDLEGTKAIGRDFRKVVHLPASKHVGFSQHADIKLKKQFYWSSFKGDLQV